MKKQKLVKIFLHMENRKNGKEDHREIYADLNDLSVPWRRFISSIIGENFDYIEIDIRTMAY